MGSKRWLEDLDMSRQEARLISADIKWHQSKLLDLKAAALSDRKYKRPVYTATQFVRIWNPRNFWVEKTRPGTGETLTWRAHESPRHAEERGDLLGVSDLESGLAFEIERRGDRTAGSAYSLKKYDRREVFSGGILWRLRLLRHRTECNFKNGVHAVGVQLWSGSLGIRALFALRPFQVYDWTVDRNTGKLAKVQTAERHTFLNRLSELWSHAYRSRQQFEAEPSTGIIGKGIARPFNLVWNYVVEAALGTTLLCLFIPAATALNALVSLGVIVTSPVWAPGFALLQYLWEVLIFDGVTNRISPLVIALFWGLGVTGIGNVALSLVLAILHPVIGAVIYVGGGLGIGVVAVWDWLMFWGLLRWHARIPSSDTFLCRRISGGGIVETQTYFVQVAPTAVLLALRLQLQTMLLQAQLEALLWDVNAPVREASRIRDVLEPMGVTVSLPTQGVRSTYGRLDRIFERARALEAEVKNAFAARFRKLEHDPRSDVRNKVRLTREDLHRTLPIAQDVARRFIAQRFLPVRSRYRNGSLNASAEFWKGQGLTDNDWTGLTRKLLALSVSDGVLTPLEDDARGLSLRVEHVTPREYVRMLVDNEVHDDLEVARVVEPLSKTAGAGGLRWRDAYSTGLSCGLRLLRDDSPQVWPVDEMDGAIDELSSFTPCGRIGFEYSRP